MTATGSTAPDNFAYACCTRWGADRGRFALYCDDDEGRDSAWTFWDIQREANRFSNVFAALGVMRGDRVALIARPSMEAAAACIACLQMGAIFVPLSADAGGAGAAQARVGVVDASGRDAVAGLPGRPRHVIGLGAARADWVRAWQDIRPLAAARFSGLDGMAGEPALLAGGAAGAFQVVTHAGLGEHARRFAAAHRGFPQPGDLCWSPAGWEGTGLLDGLLAAWYCGGAAVVSNRVFSAASAFALIGKYDVRNIAPTRAQLEALMAAAPKPNDLDECRLRSVVTGGEPWSPALAAWVETELGATGEQR